MQGGDLGGNVLQLHVAGQVGQWQLADRTANGFVQPGGGLAGGCGQADTVLAPCPLRAFPGHGLQGCQKIHHGGGLAGTRATGDHGKAVTGGQGAGQFLIIHRLCGPEQFAERCG